jgi:hypothetical protein
MDVLTFPKDAVKVIERENEISIEFFALTTKEKEQFNNILNIPSDSSTLSNFSDEDILNEVKERFDISELIDI